MSAETNTQAPEKKRCVIYTRKSTDEGLEKEYNTLESQFDACAAYIQSQAGQGWELQERHYDDGGFSGGNMDRPALKQLLADISRGLVDVVVVYKIDRISRSLADFCELTKIFKQANVSLVSITQQIDTSTSMGRMIVHLLVSFGQFEREIDSDRIRDKMAAMRKKGMWSGGVVPYGYKLEGRKLRIDEEAAQAVRGAFDHYLATNSYLETARRLNAEFGPRTNGKPWNVEHVRFLMRNAMVAGRIRDPHTGELFEAQQEAIVPFDKWMEVQKIITERAKGKRERKCGYIAPLKGFIRCGYCGGAMVPTFTGKGEQQFRYYRCLKHHKHMTDACKLKSISADGIEVPVFEAIARLLTDEVFLQLVSEDRNEMERNRSLGLAKAELIRGMTQAERRRIAEKFLRRVEVTRDGFSLLVREDGLRNVIETKEGVTK